MVKHIIFDLGQVLVNVRFPEFLEKFAAEFQISPSLLLENRGDGAHIDFMLGKKSPEEFHRATCEYFNHYVSLEDFKQLWLNMLDGVIEDTVKIVGEIDSGKFQLSILSNIDPWHFEYCEKNIPVLNLFKNKFLSYKLGVRKPDPAIFLKVLSELGSASEKCLFIDDKQNNIDSAKKLGFQVIKFNSGEELLKDLIELGIFR